MKRAVTIFAVLSVIAYVYWTGRRHDEQLAALGAQLDALSRPTAVAATAGREPALPPSVMQALAARAAAAAPTAPAASGPPVVEPRVAAEDYAQRLEHDRFATRPRDAKLTGRAFERVQALADGSSTVSAVECRGELCRIEVDHADGNAAESFVARAFQHAPTEVWNGASFTSTQPSGNGRLVTVTYLAPEGAPLPTL